MAYFAKIEDGIVTNVIVASQEFIDAGHVEGTWLETTFGAVGGVVYEQPVNDGITIFKDGMPDIPKPIPTDTPCVRKNYAGIGYTWDGTGFAAPQPYASWSLNTDTYLWEAPTPMPTDGQFYRWVETDLNWQVIEHTTD
jgi:hypothetical protein